MKTICILLLLFCTVTIACAQKAKRDSLQLLLSKANHDTTKVLLLSQLWDTYGNTNPDSMFLYANQALKISMDIGYKKGEMNCKEAIANYWWAVGDYATALKLYLQLLDYVKTQKDSSREAITYSYFVNAYRDQGDYKQALHYGFLGLKLVQNKFPIARGMAHALVGSIYYGMDKYDSANFYLTKAINYPHTIGIGWIFLMYGRTQAKLNNSQIALNYYRRSIKVLRADNGSKGLAGAYNSIGELFHKTGNLDSALYYGKQAMNISRQKKFNKELLESHLLLSTAFEKVNPTYALEYYKSAMAVKDSLFNQEKQRQISSIRFNEELRQNEIKNTQIKIRSRNRTLIMIGVLIGFLFFVIYLVRTNRQKQKVNALLQQQKQEIESTLNDLKETQEQLVHREKMASLGELTAGIAHEIQNPLNFVNNFSEVNKELFVELRQELTAGNKEEVLAIINTIEENSEKINNHGQRADAIVKNMLQHSRTNSGLKVPTNINALTEEYLRLAYHGLRAKSKEFNTNLITDLDSNLRKVEVVPQELGRVLLNLFNNAFYATEQKKTQLNGQYQPEVKVSTCQQNGQIMIKVRDNGTGMPDNVKNKIFQPFFTTKPTGQGTGLGLSLSYDIIKVHGGELKVESIEGEGSEFIIQLRA